MDTLERLLGGYLVAVCGALILYGLCTAQSYLYMLNSKDDHILLQTTVLVVWVLETAHTAFVIHMLYYYTITSATNLLGEDLIVWSVGAAFISELVIIVLVQGFYIRRVWILSKRSYVLVIVTSTLLLVRAAFGLGTSVLLYTVPSWSEFQLRRAPKITINGGLSCSVVVDFIIAALLVFYLRRGQLQSRFRKTHDVIRICMAYAVNTGAVTMMVSIFILATFRLVKESLLFAGLTLVASKLYANSFLGTLNAREMLRRKNEINWQEAPLSESHSHALRQIAIYQNSMKTSKVDDGHYIPTDSYEAAV